MAAADEDGGLRGLKGVVAIGASAGGDSWLPMTACRLSLDISTSVFRTAICWPQTVQARLEPACSRCRQATPGETEDVLTVLSGRLSGAAAHLGDPDE